MGKINLIGLDIPSFVRRAEGGDRLIMRNEK